MNIFPLDFNRDGLSLRGFLYLPDAEGPFNLVILAHGFGSNLTITRHIAEALSKDNLASYVFDFSGGSEDSTSDGAMLDMTVLTQKEDLLAVIDGFTSFGLVKSIHVMGSSQGGLVAALAAKEREDLISGLVLLYPAFSIPDQARRDFPERKDILDVNERLGSRVGRAYYETVYDMDVFKEIEGFSKPVLLVHGEDDELVPVEYSEKALEVYPDARLYKVKGQGHQFTSFSLARALDEISAFIKRDEPEPVFPFFTSP